MDFRIVLLAVQCTLQTNPITQPWVRYIHTAVTRASYTLPYLTLPAGWDAVKTAPQR